MEHIKNSTIVTSDDFFVYKLLTIIATFFWISVLHYDTIDAEYSDGYDITNSILNFDIMVPPSLCFFVHYTIETFFIKLYQNSTFLMLAAIISIVVLIYELIFCLSNLKFLLNGYHAWFICCSLFTIGIIMYLLKIRKIKSLL